MKRKNEGFLNAKLMQKVSKDLPVSGLIILIEKFVLSALNNEKKLIKSGLLILVSLIFSFSIPAQKITTSAINNSTDGTLIEQKIYTFPSYEQAVEKTDVEKCATS